MRTWPYDIDVDDTVDSVVGIVAVVVNKRLGALARTRILLARMYCSIAAAGGMAACGRDRTSQLTDALLLSIFEVFSLSAWYNR